MQPPMSLKDVVETRAQRSTNPILIPRGGRSKRGALGSPILHGSAGGGIESCLHASSSRSAPSLVGRVARRPRPPLRSRPCSSGSLRNRTPSWRHAEVGSLASLDSTVAVTVLLAQPADDPADARRALRSSRNNGGTHLSRRARTREARERSGSHGARQCRGARRRAAHERQDR